MKRFKTLGQSEFSRQNVDGRIVDPFVSEREHN